MDVSNESEKDKRQRLAFDTTNMAQMRAVRANAQAGEGQAGSSAANYKGKASMPEPQKSIKDKRRRLRYDTRNMGLTCEERQNAQNELDRLNEEEAASKSEQTYYSAVYKDILAGRIPSFKKMREEKQRGQREE